MAQKDLDRLYVQCPDRLASGAKLIILVEEFQQHGVEVVFLRGSVEDTAEGKLLLHMQGAIAEYERTKIMERIRRGKLYWARQGAFVGGHTPYGYRLVKRTDGHRARFEVNEYEALVVRQMYHWLVEEGLSTRAICKRLTEMSIATATGGAQWGPTTVSRILRNPVYRGSYLYQRAESVLPSRRLNPDRYRGGRKTWRKPRPQEEWITIPVPATVDEAAWNAAQGQLQSNSESSRRNNKRHQYLLRGLIKCPRCGGTYTGYAQHGSQGYRCYKSSQAVPGGEKCPPGAIKAQPVEEAVWGAVKEALQQPQVLVEEYQRRLAQSAMPDAVEAERKQVALALKRNKAQEDRITDAYINEAMELDRYKAEMEKLRQRSRELEKTSRDIERRAQQEIDSRNALEHLERFCRQIAQGLEAMTFEERQQLLRLVVERIIVEDGRVRIETVIPTGDDKLRTPHPELVEG